MALSPTSSRGGSGLGNVVLSGTPSASQIIVASSGTAAAWTTPTQVLLSTTTLGGAGTIDVSGIAGTYNHLKLVLIAKGTNAANSDTLCMRFNNDSGSNYYSEIGRFNAGTAGGIENLATSSAQLNPSLPAGTAPFTNAFGMHVIWIPGYASTTWLKSYTGTCHGSPNTTTANQVPSIFGGTWNSTAALTRVTFFGLTTANLATSSVLYIYGVL